MTASAMTASRSSSITVFTNDRSIFTTSRGKLLSSDSDEKPTPKSSIAMCTPCSRSTLVKRSVDLEIAHRRGFRDLDAEILEAHAGVRSLDEAVDECRVLELQRREVEEQPKIRVERAEPVDARDRLLHDPAADAS